MSKSAKEYTIEWITAVVMFTVVVSILAVFFSAIFRLCKWIVGVA